MSMFCPKCGHHSECRDSRSKIGACMTRRYNCLSAKCRMKWSTVEIITQGPSKALASGGHTTNFEKVRARFLEEGRQLAMEELRSRLGILARTAPLSESCTRRYNRRKQSEQ